MYCPKCGNTVNQKLKYCNNCGEQLKSAEADSDSTPGKMLDHILTTLFLVVMFGMGILVGLVAVLLDKDVKTDIVMLIVIVYLLAIFGICFSLARQATKLIDYRLKGWSTQRENAEHEQLPHRMTPQLDEFREPVMSVTDHTTKTLDKVPLKGD
jgi:hypothetical protein